MAEKLGVGHSTYRTWESGTEGYAGPTRQQAQWLNGVLLTLIREDYTDGQALKVWGWPADREMEFNNVSQLMRSAGLFLQNPQAAAPSVVFWAQRLREPNLVHGVLALAAAAATRADISVQLFLDDAGLSPQKRRGMVEDLEYRIDRWFEFANGKRSKLVIKLYSDVLTDEVLGQRGWVAIEQYLSAKSSALEYLIASKIISPLQYDTDAEQSVLELLRQAQSLSADRLMTPIRTWILFDHIVRSLAADWGNGTESIVTLGGEDERVRWELWHRECAEERSVRVRHIYLRPVPMPDYRVPWQEKALTAGMSRPTLTTYLRNRTAHDGNTELMEWIIKAAVGLPSALNSDFRAWLPPALADPDTSFQGSRDHFIDSAPAVAEAVTRWVNA
jgi:hypothetical protein